MTLYALGIGRQTASHLEAFADGLRIVESVERALAELVQQRADLVVIDAEEVAADLEAALKLLTAPNRALAVLREAAPDPVALLSSNAWWLPRALPPERATPALIAAAERASVHRENAVAADSLEVRLREHGEWAKSARRTLDELLHELKTPIFVVQGFASNLLDEIDGPLAPSQRSGLQRIHAAAKLMGEVVKNAAPRLEPPPLKHGAPPVRRRRAIRAQLDLEALSREAAALFSREVEQRSLALSIEVLDPLPNVWGDRGRLTQVLVNLLSNAMRYVPDRGKIAVELRRDGDACEIAVLDDGPGISLELAEWIFDSGVSGQGRTGLGLAIAREIADEHQGSISADPTGPLGGAAFRLRIPVDARARAGRLEILLIDDPVLAGQLLIELKNRHGTHVPASRPRDMEALASRLIELGSTVVFAGRLEERLGTQTIDLPSDLALE